MDSAAVVTKPSVRTLCSSCGKDWSRDPPEAGSGGAGLGGGRMGGG